MKLTSRFPPVQTMTLWIDACRTRLIISSPEIPTLKDREEQNNPYNHADSYANDIIQFLLSIPFIVSHAKEEAEPKHVENQPDEQTNEEEHPCILAIGFDWALLHLSVLRRRRIRWWRAWLRRIVRWGLLLLLLGVIRVIGLGGDRSVGDVGLLWGRWLSVVRVVRAGKLRFRCSHAWTKGVWLCWGCSINEFKDVRDEELRYFGCQVGGRVGCYHMTGGNGASCAHVNGRSTSHCIS